MKNIKITLVLFLLVISPLVLNAQKKTIGPSVGVNLIQIEDTYLGSNFQLGMHIGAEINYNFKKRWSLNSGLFFTQKKKHYSFVDTTTTFDAGGLIGGIIGGGGGTTDPNDLQADVYNTTNGVVTENFIQIPFLLSYKLKKFNFFIGPTVGYLVSANRKEETTSESTAADVGSIIPGGAGILDGLLTPSSTPVTKSTSSTKGLRAFDLSAEAGVGYSMDNVKFNLMYAYGLLDYREKKENGFENLSLIRFSVVYLFPFHCSKKKEAVGGQPSIY
ncbi:MAG: PorT family protein [Vicingaceae bacterium]|nr:PorT family protein [Vicingaceae bacterium]